MNLADEIDLRVLDAASKVSFTAVEQRRRLAVWWRRCSEQCQVWRTQNPERFDQIAVVIVAGLMECVAAALGRRSR